MKDPVRTEVAERLRLARARAGLSKRAAAEAVGVSETALYQWEHAKTMPTLDKALKLARTYGMTVSEIVGDDAEATDRMAQLEARLARLERNK